MNRNRYRLTRNRQTGLFVPVAEFVKSHAGRACACGLGVLVAGAVLADPPVIAANALPAGASYDAARISGIDTVGNVMTIHQGALKAVINWNGGFNVGRDATVNFDQAQGAAAATLNRVNTAAGMSVIQGHINAPGTVYIINQNGILFDRGSQINVSSLVASALDMDDALFENPNVYLSNDKNAADFVFKGTADEFATSYVRVEADARIKAALGGSVILLAPRVENAGNIETPGGQTVLAGGGKVYLAYLEQPEFANAQDQIDYENGLPSHLRGLAGMLVEVDPYVDAAGQARPDLTGQAANEALGKIVAERGNVTIAGFLVNQSGRISATSTVNQKGSIRLIARDSGDGVMGSLPLKGSQPEDYPIQGDRPGQLVLGENSHTEVLPDLNDATTSLDEQFFNRSLIQLSGNTVEVKAGSRLLAPGGEIQVNAEGEGARIYLAEDSLLDVSGTSERVYGYWGAFLNDYGRSAENNGDTELVFAMERNLMEAQLRGTELADAPLQRDSFLDGATIQVDVRKGTPLANVSGYLAQLGRPIGERSAAGGGISLTAGNGEVVVRAGARLDVSGGYVRYADGYLDTTKLVDAGGKVVDISQAQPDQVYQGFVDAPADFEGGYVQGFDAGALSIQSRTIVFEGELAGQVVAGIHQRTPDTRPKGGGLNISHVPVDGLAEKQVLFALGDRMLPQDFNAETALPADWVDRMILSPAMLQDGGISRLALNTLGRIEVATGTTLNLGYGGTFSATGREIDVLGDIVAPGGAVDLTTKEVAGLLLPNDRYDIRVSGSISTAGEWVNDSPGIAGAGASPVFIDGGSITLDSVSDLILSETSLLDVSGGAWRTAARNLKYGDAGDISLGSGRLNVSVSDPQTSIIDLKGRLAGYAPGKGGGLSISTSSIRIGGDPSGRVGELWLAPEFFQQGGFLDYTLNGQDGLTVADKVTVAPLAQTLVFDTTYLYRPTGTSMGAFSRPQVLEQIQRAVGSLTLSADSISYGNVWIGDGARLEVDPAGTIDIHGGQNVTVLGAVVAHGGEIRLSTPNKPEDDDAYSASQAIWLGGKSLLDVSGLALTYRDDRNLIVGEVLNGGKVDIDAGQGYVVSVSNAVSGTSSIIDVSGTHALLDIVGAGGYERLDVASAGGEVTIRAREGMLLDGTYRAKGGTVAAAGGKLTLALDADYTYIFGSAFYPDAERVFKISQTLPATGFVPMELAPGDGISDDLNGQAFLAAKRVMDAGFDRLDLSSESRIEFTEDVNLALRKEIRLDAPLFSTAPLVHVDIAAAHVALGYTDTGADNKQALMLGLIPAQQAPQPTAGDGTFTAHAGLIDISGNSVLQGVGSVVMESTGDIRLNGVVVDADGDSQTTGDWRLLGSLATAGDLQFKAAQTYPTTLSQFTLNVGEHALFSANGKATKVLSAGGGLTVNASTISQEGVLKAPFGSLSLNASQVLTLADGSVTSVSGEGMTVPFGGTLLSGLAYVYALNADASLNIPIDETTLPEKRISLNAPMVAKGATASIDLSGGGELSASEFLPGPGGSQDVLDPSYAPGTFAILPDYNPEFAPYDFQANINLTGLSVGDKIYLSGGDGLAANYYTLLPASYALLPGARLVTPVAGSTDMPAGQAYTLASGAQVISGYQASLNHDGTLTKTGRSSGFLVKTGAQVRKESEYLETSVSDFFSAKSGVNLPRDAGHLVVSVTQALSLKGGLNAAPDEGGRGALVDIAATRLAVTGQGGEAVDLTGYVVLDAQQLSDLGAASLLLGGTRAAGDSGDRITVLSDDLVVANSETSALLGGEIILVANENLALEKQAQVWGAGAYQAGTDSLLLGDVSTPGSGNGALLRVASGEQVDVVRNGVDSSGGGNLKLAEGAVVAAYSDVAKVVNDQGEVLEVERTPGAITLDATGTNTLLGGVDFAGKDLKDQILHRKNGGALRIGSSGISLVEPEADPDNTAQGLVLTQAKLTGLGLLEELALKSYSSIDLYGSLDSFPRFKSLVLEAPLLVGHGGDSTLKAADVLFRNPDGTSAAAEKGAGTFTVEADSIRFGEGQLAIGGFEKVSMQADAILQAEQSGALTVAGDLDLSGPSIQGLNQADYRWTASAGDLKIIKAGSGTWDGAAGVAKLRFGGDTITSSGAIAAPAGLIEFTAVNALKLESGASLNAKGFATVFADKTIATPAGDIVLVSDAGDVTLDAGASADVSAVAGGEAGRLAISAVAGTATMAAGTIKGTADTKENAGRFSLDVKTLASFSALNSELNSGGFNRIRDLRVRTGDVTIASTDRVHAHQFKLAADGAAVEAPGQDADGNITVEAPDQAVDGNNNVQWTIDASGDVGGRIGLYAGNGLKLEGGTLNASATVAGARGGQVELAVGEGKLDLPSGKIDVSAGQGGQAGEVLLRAMRSGDGAGSGVNVSGKILTEIVGAENLVLEAVQRYDSLDTLNAANFATFAADNATFMANSDDIEDALGKSGDASFHLRPGVQVDASDDLTVSADWNLYSANRPGGEPGVLTLRAEGDLKVDGSISDGFSTATTAGTQRAGESWSYRLVAGADTNAADPMATEADAGSFVLAAGKLIRTGNGDIAIAAGADVSTLGQNSVIYTAGVPGAAVADFFNIRPTDNPNFPVNGGDIGVFAQGDIRFAPSSQFIVDWLYRQGALANDGTLANGNGTTTSASASPNPAWWINIPEFKQGIGALGGGNVVVQAGGDIVNLSVVVPTNGRLAGAKGTLPDLDKLVVQGGGDFRVSAGGDVRGGLFYVAGGTGRIDAGGGFIGSGDGNQTYPVLALDDASIVVQAMNDIVVQDVVDPLVLTQAPGNYKKTGSSANAGRESYFFGYGDSGISLFAAAGNVDLINTHSGNDGTRSQDIQGTYPGTLVAAAPKGDVTLRGNLTLYPSAGGDLMLLAGGDLNLDAGITMLDLPDEYVPNVNDPRAKTGTGLLVVPSGVSFHAPELPHLGDDTPVYLVALQGDVAITSPITTAEPFWIQAGQDIVNPWVIGQNLEASDTSRLLAGGDIRFVTDVSRGLVSSTDTRVIRIGGPGRLEALAGGEIDLGTTQGILSVGASDNPYLPQEGASIIVAAGLGADANGQVRLPDYSKFELLYLVQDSDALNRYWQRQEDKIRAEERHNLDLAGLFEAVVDETVVAANLAESKALYSGGLDDETRVIQVFFNELREGGLAGARGESYALGYDAIAALFPNPVENQGSAGDINLFFSQIKTQQGGDIAMFAPAGTVNAGLANPGGLAKSASELGIVTVSGGSISAMVDQDFAVNQSRVFTLGGGDILLWSSHADIDAGRGSKTASATPPPQKRLQNGSIVLVVSGSIAGSGIGTLFSSKDIVPGDVDLIAPEGEVNAGDAGIRVGGNLNIAAVRVVGADNIQVGGIAAGVPISTSGLSVGLSVGNLSDVSKSSELATRSIASGAATTEQTLNDAKQALASFKPSFISVEVLGFGDGTASVSERPDEAERKRLEEEERRRRVRPAA